MRRAVVVCPGRGTYNKGELGVIGRTFAARPDLLARFDALRADAGQDTLTALDGATRFSPALHTRGDNASALIYAAGLGDFLDLADIEVVAVTGNSMGWYTALACAGAATSEAGFTLANTMGRLMQEAMIGGQLVYPVVGDDWVPDPARRAALLDIVAGIDARPGHTLALSIDLGGMLVLAGDAAGLDAFVAAVPPSGQFPLRLTNHAAFHTALQAPVAARGQASLPENLFGQPGLPLIDGRGAIWWPDGTNPADLRAYTLGHQVTATYDFTRAITVAAREFAPDLFVVTGPGTTLGGATAQALIAAGWKGLRDKDDFQTRQASAPCLIAMGRPDQRRIVTA